MPLRVNDAHVTRVTARAGVVDRCDGMTLIRGDLPPPLFNGGEVIHAVEPIRTVALITIPAYTLLFSLGAGPVPW